MKKQYSAPSIKTEKIEIGVFGSYGSCGNGQPGGDHGFGDHSNGLGHGHDRGRGHDHSRGGIFRFFFGF